MKTPQLARAPEVVDGEWVTFPGGELEGPRPKVLCPTCRQRLIQTANTRTPDRAPRTQPLCFSCYRATLNRERALRAAAELDTASELRFQSALPFEPVNRSRLECLRVERAAARASEQAGVGRYVDQRRRAQIAARHALERIMVGVQDAVKSEQHRAVRSALHAAELQLPEAWLPFVAVQNL